MTLRAKTLLIIGLALSGLFIVLYFTLSSILMRGFAQVEDQDTQRNVQRALEALQNDVDNVDALLGDWAPWDDTYAFVQDGNQDYINNNLASDTLANLDLSMMIFLNQAGDLVYGTGYDLDKGEATTIPASLFEHFAQHPELIHHDSADDFYAGIIMLPEGPLLIASQPVLPSDKQGEIHGTMIMARWLDDTYIAGLGDQIQLDTSIDIYSESALVSTNEPLLVQPISNTKIAGYTLLKDLYGAPALTLRIEMARDVYAQGQQSLRLLVLSLGIVAGVSILLTLLLLERLVLARLAHLSVGVALIGARGDLAERLSMPGKDELAKLAGAINKMLEDLQASQARERALRQEIQELRIEIDHVKQQRQVAEITETDFFKDIQQKSKAIRNRISKLKD